MGKSARIISYGLLGSIFAVSTAQAATGDSGGGFPIYGYILIAVTLALIAMSLFISSARGKQFLGDTKIRTCLFLLTLTLLSATIVVGGYSGLAMKKIGTEIVEISERNLPLTEIITVIETHQLEQAIWFERSMRFKLEGREADFSMAKKQFLKYSQKVNQEIKQGEELAENAVDAASNPAHKQKFKEILDFLIEIEKEHADFDDHVQKAFDLTDVHSNRAILDRIENEEDELDHKLEDFLVKLGKFTAQSVEQTAALEQRAIHGIFAILALAVVAGFTLAFLVTKGIVSPILAAVAFSRQVSKGDLTGHLDIRQKNEIGVLAAALNEMVKNLNLMVDEIGQSTQTLTASAVQLSAASEQISANSIQTSQQSSSVAAASEQMSSNMTSIAAATEQTSTNIQTIVAATEEMNETVNEMSTNTSKASEITGSAVESAIQVSGKVENLGRAATEINKVTETIADISEQTNLLALNATIEAARAGEAGKGFGVVANEIKILAQQTAEANNEINRKISGVQSTTTESVEAIQSIVAVINEINDIVISVASAVEEQSATSREIARNVGQASVGVEEVNVNVKETTQATGEVSRNVFEVSQAAEETSQGSQEVHASAGDLSELAARLSRLVNQFSV